MKLRDLFANADRTNIEKWCRAQTQQAYIGEGISLCRVLGQFLMYVDGVDQSLAPHLMMNGFWEMWVTQAIVSHVVPGMRCVDVGANFGYYTLLLSELSDEEGEVFAFEPHRRAAQCLQASARLSKRGRVTVSDVAIGEVEEEAKLYQRRDLLGSSSLRHATDLPRSPTYPMKVRPLDRVFADDDRPIDFVKIDVQGYELQVLAGMKAIIARSPRIAIAMEFTPGDHEDPAQALATIQGYGLQIKTIGTDGQVRPVALEDAVKPDTGDHRMLWLTRA